MMWEEAIEILRKRQRYCKVIADHANETVKADELLEVDAIDMAITALRPVSREQVEKMKSPWKSYFNGDYNDEIYYCEECGHKLESASKLPNFCPDCGVPKTDEAVEMVMEKMEALKDG